MNIYTCTKFNGFYPVGTAAVVVANTARFAAAQLNYELAELGLNPTAKQEDMVLINTDAPNVVILCDGNY